MDIPNHMVFGLPGNSFTVFSPVYVLMELDLDQLDGQSLAVLHRILNSDASSDRWLMDGVEFKRFTEFRNRVKAEIAARHNLEIELYLR